MIGPLITNIVSFEEKSFRCNEMFSAKTIVLRSYSLESIMTRPLKITVLSLKRTEVNSQFDKKNLNFSWYEECEKHSHCATFQVINHFIYSSRSFTQLSMPPNKSIVLLLLRSEQNWLTQNGSRKKNNFFGWNMCAFSRSLVVTHVEVCQHVIIRIPFLFQRKLCYIDRL